MDCVHLYETWTPFVNHQQPFVRFSVVFVDTPYNINCAFAGNYSSSHTKWILLNFEYKNNIYGEKPKSTEKMSNDLFRNDNTGSWSWTQYANKAWKGSEDIVED